MSLLYLALSLLVLILVPLIEKLSRGKQRFEHLLSSFLIVVLAGIVLGEIIPMSYQAVGWWAVPMIIIGLSGPTLIEKLFSKAADSTHQVTLLIGICGLMLHAMIDGASLNEYEHLSSASGLLGLAVVLHRIPVALMILLLLRPLFGRKGVWMGLMSVAIFTLFGYVLGLQIEKAISSEGFALLQSFVAGTLLHVLIHQPHKHDHSHNHKHSLWHEVRAWRTYNLIGAGLGVVTLVTLALLHH
ncbi:hypothetical protein HMF8227_00756 [Saliniradius amylolyticus]|uniref:Uncharacterized protein n=1 Tax=Saliniradius amylolyticus TaxID=2183582 RepID=A0A2S2E146_9ALTE|nr:hypothetical protein [Saliniradius amylolyticus]AWL11252.1 hypothetical protein HMF8227_00756 [Saliniradius amylolyticus]